MTEEDLQNLPQVSQLNFEIGHGSLTSLTGKKPSYTSSFTRTTLMTAT